ncbi:Peptidyl-prolyl cis-trans isomerase PIN4 [Apiospora saccharicola]|uniref:Peptidyl-prolyl cis-trans isomerase n=1 Tax=Apiospora saccharicola TaxID=335842 RepID=A0ABR1UFJ3_9PEZI
MAKGNKKADDNKSKKDTKVVGAKGKGKGGATEEKAAPVKGAQHAKIRHILCEKHSKKEEARALLLTGTKENNFDAVARKYSEDKAKLGGLLPRVTKGLTPYDPAFMEVAFSIPECKVDDVSKYAASLGEVKTPDGYHILLREPL